MKLTLAVNLILLKLFLYTIQINVKDQVINVFQIKSIDSMVAIFSNRLSLLYYEYNNFLLCVVFTVWFTIKLPK